MLTGNALVGQSGGPTSVINASLAGVIRGCWDSQLIDKIYGAVYGIDGVLSDNIIRLEKYMNLELLKVTPSAYLGSCRSKLPEVYDETYDKIFEIFEKYNIKYFFYIGGNDSMDTVNKINKYAILKGKELRVIGVPKTIDNDLAITDHTPGFGSAAKYIATTTREIARDCVSYDIDFITIIEVMGRHAGWLTAATALARCEGCSAPHLIYLPEIEFSFDKFFVDVDNVLKTERNIMIVVSEGLKTEDGKFLCDSANANALDAYGHQQLSGTALVLKQALSDRYDCKIRAVEYNLMQRCASHSQSKVDVDESFLVGKTAVERAVDGESGVMLCFHRISENPYKVEILTHSIDKIANVEKFIPSEWISPDGNDVLQPCIDYMLPLIQGEINHFYQDGLPIHLIR